MKIKEVKLINSDIDTSIGSTGFSVRVNNKYELLIEETTPLGFKAINAIEVPIELSQELYGYLNEFAKKCVDFRKQQTYPSDSTTGVQIKYDKNSSVSTQII